MPVQTDRRTDRSVDVALVCGLDLEAAPLVQRLDQRRTISGNRFLLVEGTLGDRRVAVLRSGEGHKRLVAAVDALVFVHRPRWVVAAGFATGLSDQLRVGNILLANELVDGESGQVAVELPFSPEAARSADLHIGRLLSSARWPRQAEIKRKLGAETGAWAADLQSFTVARLCSEQGTKSLAIRIIADEASVDAAPESLAVYSPSRSYRTGAAVGAFLSGFGRASKIWKLRGTAKKLAERLASVVVEILPRFL